MDNRLTVIFNHNGIKVEIPSYIIDDSLTIREMMMIDVEVDRPIVINTTIQLSSLEDISDQDLLLLLDFLNCPNLILTTGMKVINDNQPLIESTQRLFYPIPQLAYSALSKNLITIDYPIDSYLFQPDNLQQWIDNDIEKLIPLLNLGLSPTLLLPEITTSVINSIDTIICNRQWNACRCHPPIKIDNTSSLSTMLISLIDRLDELNYPVLEPLIRHFRYSIILDRMFRLRLIDNIRNLVNDDLIPGSANYSWLAVELRDDQLVDLVMELQLNGSRTPAYPTAMCYTTYATSFLAGALEYNYLYPLKYVISYDTIRGLSIRDVTVNIDQEGFTEVLAIIEMVPYLMHRLVDMLVLGGRIDLALPLLSHPSINIESLRSRWGCELLLSYLADEDQYQQVMGYPLVVDIRVLAKLIRSDYTGLAKSLADSLTNDQLAILLSSYIIVEDDRIVNIGMLTRITELVSIDSFRQFVVDKIAEYQPHIDRCVTSEDYQRILLDEMGITDLYSAMNSSLELFYQILLTSTLITIRHTKNEINTIDIEEFIQPITHHNEEVNILDEQSNSVPDKIILTKQSCSGSNVAALVIDNHNRGEKIESMMNQYVTLMKQLIVG